MAHALQHHQRDQLRSALLCAGANEETAVERLPFVVTEVDVGGNYIVAFCRTSGHARIHGLTPREAVDLEAYSDSLSGTPDVPDDTGTYAAVGLVHVTKPKVGKPTLHIEILRYVRMDEAEDAYQSLLRQREVAPIENDALPASVEGSRRNLVLA